MNRILFFLTAVMICGCQKVQSQQTEKKDLYPVNFTVRTDNAITLSRNGSKNNVKDVNILLRGKTTGMILTDFKESPDFSIEVIPDEYEVYLLANYGSRIEDFQTYITSGFLNTSTDINIENGKTLSYRGQMRLIPVSENNSIIAPPVTVKRDYAQLSYTVKVSSGTDRTLEGIRFGNIPAYNLCFSENIHHEFFDTD